VKFAKQYWWLMIVRINMMKIYGTVIVRVNDQCRFHKCLCLAVCGWLARDIDIPHPFWPADGATTQRMLLKM